MMKIVFLLLLSVVLAAGEPVTAGESVTLNGTFRFDKFAANTNTTWIEDGAAAPVFFINGITMALFEMLNNTDLTVIGEPVAYDDLEVVSVITVSGINVAQSDAARLVARLSVEDGLKKLNLAMKATNFAVGTVQVGTALGFSWEKRTASPGVAAKETASIVGKFFLSMAEALFLGDVIQKKAYLDHIALGLGQTLGMGDNLVLIKAALKVKLDEPAADSGRRLLATNKYAVDFTMDDVSPAQAEAIRSSASSPSFPDTLDTKMAAINISSLNESNSSDIVMTLEGDVYQAPDYAASASVGAGHATTRLHGTNKFPTDFQNELMPWGIGLATTAGFMFFMMLISIIAFPCCYCCCFKVCKCGKKKEGPLKLLDAALVFAALSVLFALVGLILTMQGEASMAAAFGDFESALTLTETTLTSFDTALASLDTNLQNLSSSLEPFSSCELTESIRSATNVSGLNITTGDIGTQIMSAKTGVVGYGSTLSNSTKGVGAVMFLATLLFAGFVIQIKKGGAKMERCRSGGLGVVAAIFIPILILCWLLSGVFQVLSVGFADFCIKDPIPQIFSFVEGVPVDGVAADPNDPIAMIKFFVTCEGTAPAMLMQVYDMSTKFSDVAENLKGMRIFLGATDGCKNVIISEIDSSITAVSVSIAALSNLARCKTFNPIFVEALHSGVCTQMQAGFAGLATGLVFLSLFLMVAMCTFNRENRVIYTNGNKVQPDDAKKPLTVM